MSERNPAIDPRPGDELRGDPWRYRVVANENGEVWYRILYDDWGDATRLRVSLPGWRDMAAGLTVERVG